MKILVTSDLHLSDRIWKHRPIEGDSYHSWHQIVDLAIEHECEVVILAGDILDKQTNVSRPVKELVEGLKRLAEHEIDIWYNQGQHEYQTMPWMSLDNDTIWLQGEEPFEAGELKFAGCDFHNAEGLLNFLQSDWARQVDVLVCHQVWLEFMGEECKPQASFADIPENVKYLITGDYHDHICQKFGNLTVLSPGSTHLRSISEPEDKEVFLLETPEIRGDKMRIKSLPLATRRKIEIDGIGVTEFNAIQHVKFGLAAAEQYAVDNGLPDELRKPVMRLTYFKDDHEFANQVNKLVGDQAHLFFKQVKPANPEDLQPTLVEHMGAEERVGMINCLDTFVDKTQKPLTHGLATKLLQAPDPEQALHQWIKEQIK